MKIHVPDIPLPAHRYKATRGAGAAVKRGGFA